MHKSTFGDSLIQNKHLDDLTKSELIQEQQRLLFLLTSNESEAMTAGDCMRLSGVMEAIRMISKFQRRHTQKR